MKFRDIKSQDEGCYSCYMDGFQQKGHTKMILEHLSLPSANSTQQVNKELGKCLKIVNKYKYTAGSAP